jgi:hypothetical protein
MIRDTLAWNITRNAVPRRAGTDWPLRKAGDPYRP